MTIADVTLRPAVPTTDDGRAFAEYLDEAQEGAFRWMLGRKAGEIIAEAFIRRGHELSFEHVTFAEQVDRIVGMASGYAWESHRAFTDELRNVTTGWRARRLAAFTRMARRMLEFIDNVPDGDFYVRAIAVDEAQRGRGIGTLLLQALEENARAAGARRLALDVAAKNRKAQKLYERMGMTVETESPRWLGLPNTNVLRLVKPL